MEGRLERALPRADVEAAYAAWLPHADTEPGEVLHVGSGWGALEVLRATYKLAGTPFDECTLGAAQAPWVELLRTGAFPEQRRVGPPGESLVAPHWRDMLETAPAKPLAEYHLGVAQWHAGDVAQAVRSWERALELAPSLWPLLRCLAVADQQAGNRERAADRYAEAFDDLCQERRDDGAAWTAATAALGREALAALLAVRRTADARRVWERLRPATRERGRFRLIEAELLLAEGDREGARAVFDAGFEVADLREGAEAIGVLWARLTDEALPDRYDFRMRPCGDRMGCRSGLNGTRPRRPGAGADRPAPAHEGGKGTGPATGPSRGPRTRRRPRPDVWRSGCGPRVSPRAPPGCGHPARRAPDGPRRRP